MTAGPDEPGGFQWNLTPSPREPDPAPKRPAPSKSAPKPPAPKPAAAPAPPARTPDPEATQQIPTAPADDWDVPTAASPIIGRSVFPLPPPAVPPQFVAPTTAFTAPLPPPLDSAMEGVTELIGAHPVGLPDPVDEGLETTDIDVVFGESKFVDYDSAAQAPTAVIPPAFAQPPVYAPLSAWPAAVAPSGSPSAFTPLPFDTMAPQPVSTVALYEGPRRAASVGMPRQQKILIGVAGGLVTLLALVALFLLGTRIGGGSAETAAVVTPTPSPSATVAVPAVGPLAAGEYAWDELRGGECLTAYESPWQDTYTVVGCSEPHTGQLLSKSALPDAAGAEYPAVTDLQSAVTLACSATTVLDYAAAEAFDDLQLDASFPATQELWDAGDRTTYCFATRAGGGDLEGSLAVSTP